MADPELYRQKAEVEEWKHRDPISLFEARMRERELLADDDIARVEQSVARFIGDAVAAAEAGPWEPVDDVLKYVTSDTP
jgi:TPP-dependent pyruvate/acetoin dehydrogenase alpha subunit